MTDSWHSYPSVFAMGHRALERVFIGDVIVEEKIDGSQFSFGVFDGELRCRSKGQQIVPDAPEKMFAPAVATALSLAPLLHDGWTYRAEFLGTPKHNVLAYNRVPAQHLIIFDINTDLETYLPYAAKRDEAERIGLECVPLLVGATSPAFTAEYMLSLLDRESVLGGPKIEGFVVKNYAEFGSDKKVVMGKFVSEAFKEIHGGEWRKMNPGRRDIVESLVASYRTEARWQKALQHLRERGDIEDSPRDIGKLIIEAREDLRRETVVEVEAALYAHFWPGIERASVVGLAEWYKGVLLERQFEIEDAESSRLR